MPTLNDPTGNSPTGNGPTGNGSALSGRDLLPAGDPFADAAPPRALPAVVPIPLILQRSSLLNVMRGAITLPLAVALVLSSAVMSGMIATMFKRLSRIRDQQDGQQGALA